MADDPERERLRLLEARIGRAKTASSGVRASRGSYSQGEIAWRMVIELVAGLVIGLGIGFGLDALFGTRPLFLVVFVLVGLAAGVKVMLQTAREIEAKNAAAPGDGDGVQDKGD